MDERKRGYELTPEGANQKRSKQDGENNGDVFSKLLLSRQEFAKVIGKGGQMIANIRAKCGANIKGSDIDDDKRLCIVTGSMRQVVDAFDIISDLLNSGNHSNPGSEEILSVSLLIDDKKAGRIVGTKGAIIQSIKQKSNTTQLQMVKEAQTILGHSLRILLVEGSLMAVRRAHFLVLNELYNPSAPMAGPPPSSYDQPSGANGLMAITTTYNPGYGSLPNATMSASSLSSAVPLNSLVGLGIHGDVVRQLRDLQSYLGQYGFDLSVVDTRGQSQFPKSSMSMPQDTYGMSPTTASGYSAFSSTGGGMAMSLYGGGGSNAMQLQSSISRDRDRYDRDKDRDMDTGNKLEFFIPKEKAGGVIGKGGVVLRELQIETGCRIRLDRDEMHGMRRVTVKHDDDSVMLRAKERILDVAAASMDHGPIDD